MGIVELQNFRGNVVFVDVGWCEADKFGDDRYSARFETESTTFSFTMVRLDTLDIVSTFLRLFNRASGPGMFDVVPEIADLGDLGGPAQPEILGA